ncbi:MauE/DoxX family redox-associated membrane protein [Candidatus Poriferisodalis sp.]|uniref:MauE/DoxX family redox-associated membrane protein n=1 Tax=Candidatus Poriferisodalis sp. TaxID=3101277 RepID=UPI003B01B457
MLTDVGPELAVVAASSVLCVAGAAKIVSPVPIASTLSQLWGGAGPSLRPESLRVLGRLVGAVEIGLAAAIVLGRSWAAAAVLVLAACLMAMAGVVGVRRGGGIPCACFGRSDRTLGWPHVAQWPLWLGAAWCVARQPTLVDTTHRAGYSVVLLGISAAAAAAVLVGRVWVKAYPLARHRRRSVMTTARRAGGTEVSAWR